MPELDNVVQTPPEGQPVNDSPQTEETSPAQENVTEVEGKDQGAGQNVSPLTEQQILEIANNPQFQKVIDQRAEQIAERKSREEVSKFQSLTDKAEARIRKEIDLRIQAFEAVSGGSISPEQRAKVAETTRQQIAEQVEQEQPQQQAHPLVQDIKRIAQKHGGVEVLASDPEANLVNGNGTMGEYLESYETAVKAKKDRLTAKPTPKKEEDNGDPNARIVTSPKKGASGLPDLSADDLFAMGYKKS